MGCADEGPILRFAMLVLILRYFLVVIFCANKSLLVKIIKDKIYEYFGESFEKFDSFEPKVNVVENFDKLLIQKEHPARSLSDTYYFDENTCLRTHTSAHQNELLSKGCEKFLVTGDVYRKDEIDSSHYPVFHQMEGVCIVEDNENVQEEFKNKLIGLVDYLFPGCEYRFNDDYFPFTETSLDFRFRRISSVSYEPPFLDIYLITIAAWMFSYILTSKGIIKFLPTIVLFLLTFFSGSRTALIVILFQFIIFIWVAISINKIFQKLIQRFFLVFSSLIVLLFVFILNL